MKTTPELELAKALGGLPDSIQEKLASSMQEYSVEELESILKKEGISKKASPTKEELLALADTWGRELAQKTAAPIGGLQKSLGRAASSIIRTGPVARTLVGGGVGAAIGAATGDDATSRAAKGALIGGGVGLASRPVLGASLGDKSSYLRQGMRAAKSGQVTKWKDPTSGQLELPLKTKSSSANLPHRSGIGMGGEYKMASVMEKESSKLDLDSPFARRAAAALQTLHASGDYNVRKGMFHEGPVGKVNRFFKDRIEKGDHSTVRGVFDPRTAKKPLGPTTVKDVIKVSSAEDSLRLEVADAAGRLMAKTAFSVTEEGHKFDAERAKVKAEAAAKLMELAQKHEGMGSSKRMGRFSKALRGFMPDPYDDPRHWEYVERQHRKGENAWNPFGGAITPSKHERGASTLQYGEFKTKKSSIQKEAISEELAGRAFQERMARTVQGAGVPTGLGRFTPSNILKAHEAGAKMPQTPGLRASAKRAVGAVTSGSPTRVGKYLSGMASAPSVQGQLGTGLSKAVAGGLKLVGRITGK